MKKDKPDNKSNVNSGWTVNKSQQTIILSTGTITTTIPIEVALNANDAFLASKPFTCHCVGGIHNGITSAVAFGSLPSVLYETEFGQYEYRLTRDDGIHIYEWVPTPEPEVTEFYTEPIVGWREWKLIDNDKGWPYRKPRYELAAFVTDYRWPGYQALEAICDKRHTDGVPSDPHSASPEWNCRCGIYAHNTLLGARQTLAWASESDVRVFGEVSLWGKVCRHTDGYRAQYAYPKKLYVVKNIYPQPEYFLSSTRPDVYPPVESRRKLNLDDVAEQLSESYGVPCHITDYPYSGGLT